MQHGNRAAHIVGSASLIGRAAAVVEGRHTGDLQDKLGATTFKMWVDDQTGVLLRLVGSDAEGNVAYHVTVQDIQFDRGVDRSHFRLAAPRNFADTSAPAAVSLRAIGGGDEAKPGPVPHNMCARVVVVEDRL
jgi:hypothetical protein